jgi:hypothetical protein
MLKGYHPTENLPLKKGHRVRFPKGTRIKTTNPRKEGGYTLLKSQTVTVDHILNGRSIVVAYKHTARYIRGSMHWRDFYHICQSRGIDYPYQKEPPIEELLKMFEDAGIELEERDASGGKCTNLLLHLDNPSVRWSGAGGYWCWADINDGEKVP